MDPKILYEDEFILALDKPSGVLVHSDGRANEETLVNWIVKNRPNIVGVGEEQRLQSGDMIKRPGIVHRLDKETSGVIIIAKTQKSFNFLKGQFQNKDVEKIYNAVVWGTFNEKLKEGKIEKPIGRHGGDFRKWSAEKGARGQLREAITEYRVLASLPRLQPITLQKNKRDNRIPGYSYLEISPKTGRTHQIRVHLKAIGHPVICDKLYAPRMVCDGSESCLGFSRLALHALSIKIELPPTRGADGRTFIKIESELPEEFKNALKLLKIKEN